MKNIFFIIFSFIFLPLLSQDCVLQHKKSVKDILRFKENIYSFSSSDEVKLLNSIKEREGLVAELCDAYSLFYWMKEDKLRSVEFASRSINTCPDKFAFSYYVLGSMSFKMKNYEQSIKYLEKAISLGLRSDFLLLANSRLDKSQVIFNIMIDTVSYNPKIVKGISTEADEYLPLISPDQEFAWFTRKGVSTSFGVVDRQSEHFITSSGSFGNFDAGSMMPYPFNESNNEGGATITIDNKFLYFTICDNYNSSYTNCDIYYVERLSEYDWSDLQSIPSINRPRSWESQPSISSDGSTLVFASDRDGGEGGIDLYVVKKNNLGEWGDPRNMGSVINSDRNEKSPFLHVDGKTLYFASQQFPSLGGYDIFFSTIGNDMSWSKPKNIGFPINTVEDELGMFVTTDGKTAYFCSNRLVGVGGWDLYSFDLDTSIAPERVLFLKGDVFDDQGNMLDSVSIHMRNLNTNQVHTIEVKEGKYVSAITLGDKDDVIITFNKDGFAFNSHYVSYDDTAFSTPSKLNVHIDKLEEGKTFTLNNIYFETDSFDLNRTSRIVLSAFVEYLERNNIELMISGHTDNIGSSDHNLDLSERRAYSVYSFLLENGIDGSRLTYKGFGDSVPIQDNSTAEGRSKNRRTEVTIINY